MSERRRPHPGGPSPTDLRSALGNRDYVRLIGSAPVQAKLTVGSSADPLERHADVVGDWIAQRWSEPVRMAEAETPATGDVEGTIARSVGAPAATAQVGPDGGEAPVEVTDGVAARRGSGRPLPPSLQRALAPDIDVSDVRVHHDPAADGMAGAIQAEAFTTGTDIFFRHGAYNPGSDTGRRLIGHEVGHVLQQSSSVRRKKTPKAPPAGKDVIVDWKAYSTVRGSPRSKALKDIDAAVDAWCKGSRPLGGMVDRNITEIQAILDAVQTWKATKTGVSVRDTMVGDLVNHLTPIALQFASRRQKKINDTNIASGLYDEFKRIDAATSVFAGKNLADVKQDRFEPDNQTDGLMAHTKKNADGTLTDEALDDLDDEQKADAAKLMQTARNAQMVIAPGVDLEDLRDAADAKTNPLSNRTQFPEIANATDPNTELAGEVTEPLVESGSTVNVTYDKSDVHAAERLSSLRQAIKLINATKAKVPGLDIFLPKLSRTITVANDCTMTASGKIADAVFHPPNFLAVSSANTGVPKTDTVGTDLKFLSAALGADDALMHTMIHEIGHALHYANARGQFYNLNFSYFKGTNSDGKTYQSIAETEVSGYGNSPREMVAEVFVGAVTGKKHFSKDVWDIYRGLGGFDPR